MRSGFGALCALSAGIALAVSVQAASADGYRSRSIKDGAQPFSWTGLYIGGHAGLATGDTQGVPDLGGAPGLFRTDYNLDGALYGGQVGFNWQTGPMVLGVEASLSGSSIQGNTTCL